MRMMRFASMFPTGSDCAVRCKKLHNRDALLSLGFESAAQSKTCLPEAAVRTLNENGS